MLKKMLPVVENELHKAQVRVRGATLCQDDKCNGQALGKALTFKLVCCDRTGSSYAILSF